MTHNSPHATPLVVIVGETASGKSALAMRLAELCNGELICADSRTVYRGLDIGTAKPSAADQIAVPHHLLDVVSPNEAFNVAQFKELANEKIAEITLRKKLPIMVGGTGLYIDSVLFDYQFSLEGGERSPNNSRHQKVVQSPDFNNPRQNTLVIGISISPENLKERITKRVNAMMDNGFIDEVQQISSTYGWDIKALSGTGYKAFHDYLKGDITLEEAKAQFVRNDWQLAKRQRTWFKRNKSIHWISTQEEAVKITTQFLNKYSSL